MSVMAFPFKRFDPVTVDMTCAQGANFKRESLNAKLHTAYSAKMALNIIP
jgi:hypothetical protein